jgi:hypothetical protein
MQSRVQYLNIVAVHFTSITMQMETQKHGPPIPSFLTPTKSQLAMSTNHEAPLCAIFSSLQHSQGPNTFLSTLFSNTLNPFYIINDFTHTYKNKLYNISVYFNVYVLEGQMKNSKLHGTRMCYPLTLILLTSTKWWAPASARKWQMVFNSAFKGLS